jgi:hypothetical protein
MWTLHSHYPWGAIFRRTELCIPHLTSQVFSFRIAYLLLLFLVLLVLPQKWLRRIVRVAFHLEAWSGKAVNTIRQ